MIHSCGTHFDAGIWPHRSSSRTARLSKLGSRLLFHQRHTHVAGPTACDLITNDGLQLLTGHVLFPPELLRGHISDNHQSLTYGESSSEW